MGSLTINISELEGLKGAILENKLTREAVKSNYELLRIKEDDISIIVYKSGKVVHNDSEASKRIIESILKKDTKYDYILGSDETGKGEWFGPLVVVATALTPEEIVELRKLGVQDSKNFKKPQLLKMAKKIINMAFVRHSLPLNPKTYNRLYNNFKSEGKNLNDMMAWAHSVVIQDTLKKIEYNKAKVVIDKFDFEKTEYRLENVDKTNLKVIQKTGGESEIPVATASIIAKYLYEKEVDKLNEKYGINLRMSNPEDIDPEILPLVAKLHFRNVPNVIS
jgi:ribonuclease HIII